VNDYQAGQVVEIPIAFNPLADPTTLSLSWAYVTPGQVELSTDTVWVYGTDSQITRNGVGNYLCMIDTSTLPTSQVFWSIATTGTAQGAAQGTFTVSAGDVPYLPPAVPSPVAAASAMPRTPLPGTGFTGPLVSFTTYQRITKDTSSNRYDVENAVMEVTADLSRELQRTLVYGNYNELLFVNKLGFTWPSALPISQVDSPFGADLQGFQVWIGFYLPLPDMPVWSGVIPPQSYVVYWGGFTDKTLHPKLQRLISTMVWYRLNAEPLVGVPAGATSVHVGSVGYSAPGGISQFIYNDREMRRTKERFARTPPRAWQ
jgi:hypothetical protein